uniref:Uncharacterized protein n=1 Tax=Tanacetum cinerariifolium TaxID=118510 RepID=A0A6L2L7L7_TANCI|nr:hypothetical protein [Tanacetum cinerariifolium]
MEHVADEAIHKDLGDSLVRAATTASSLEAKQESGDINKTHSKETPNESSSQLTDSGGGPECQKSIWDTNAQTRFKSVSTHSNDSLLARGNILQSDEDILKLIELMELCTNLQTRVLELEKTKTTQQNVIGSLTRRVKKLEKKNRSRNHKLKRLYKFGLTSRVESSREEESLGEDSSKQGRIEAIDQDEDITLVNVQKEQEANIALIETWDDVQVMIEKRRKHFAAKRAKENRNKPPIQDQKKKIMCTYLNNMEGYTLKQLKSLEFDKIQEMFDKAFKRVNTFEPIRLELVESKEKRAGEELIQEKTKKKKMEDDKETVELKQLMEIIPNEEEVAINDIPLDVKSP